MLTPEKKAGAKFAGWGIMLVLCISVIAPRLAAIGDFIHMDEGYHAFMANYIYDSYASGSGFPAEMTGYKLFPYMLAWVWGLPGNPVVWLRLGDLCMAALAGWAFCVMLMRESKSVFAGLALGSAFLMGMNFAGAIDSGFKNSYFPAFLCLFFAVNIAASKNIGEKRWLLAGALTALGVLFRETFAPFPLIGAGALLIKKDFRAFWKYVLGGIAGALIVTLILALMRRQIWGILDFYFTYGKIYEPEAARRLFKFYQNGLRALVIFSPLLALTLLLGWSFLKKGRSPGGRGWFWLACGFAPLLEPYLKIGFLYHFSACLPGFAGFCAYAYSVISSKIPYRRYMTWATAAAALIMLPYSFVHYQKLPATLAVLKYYPRTGWPPELAAKSTTLEAAEVAKKLLPPGGSAASSGFAYFLFPAAGVKSAALGLGDLSRTLIYSGADAQVFNRRLDDAPPDLVFLAKAQGDHSATFYPELKKIFNNRTDYEFADSIEQDMDKNYGWLGYDVYKRSIGHSK